ncbi:carboxypeptidase-like regulatory domain-containing protein [Demequina sp. SYSU T00039]|uniref:Carboxypeptidase-like regulatory domain-containing protein n=1 Tax=Demequina lignilytica TaxID=3051663 RepID=A0AAW7M1B0_9MICO|nr:MULTISPECIES: carboxypeptidase-like regulatory domain-containing protein [unclassified Demequina]MDN4477455.1 carboxypeptidase-like regulatory domain-containing protein [Demequina sp. SYSU T00039-1]MDN4488194.1 carboxypeptidase-like regulatory domain-containing protein [Demequina sp. SYSU T00039]
MSAAPARALRRAAATAALAAIGASFLVAAPAQAVTYSISGTVSVPDGAPAGWLGMAYVVAIGDDVEYVDVDPVTGAYTIDLPAGGDYMVAVAAEDPAGIEIPNLIPEYWPGTWYADEAETVTVAGAVTGIDIDLDYGETLYGTVTLSDGGNAEGAVVLAEGYDGEIVGAASTDEDGYWYMTAMVPEEVVVSATWLDVYSDETTYTSEYFLDAFRPEHAVVLDLGGFYQTDLWFTLDRIPMFWDAYDGEFYPEVEFLASAGITTGWKLKDGTYEYRPLSTVKRDAMAAFLYRLAGVTGYTPPKKSPFIDVPTTHPFYKEIAWLAQSEVTRGWTTSKGTEFRPSSEIGRDAMAAFLYRFAGVSGYTAPSKSAFVDVPKTHQFYTEISWLAQTGVTRGWSTSSGQKFKPASAIKRDAMAAFLYRFAMLDS